MSKSIRALCASALLALSTLAAASPSERISNGTFVSSGITPKAFYLQSIPSWSGTGMKNVGWNGGLYLGLTRPVGTGSVSLAGYDVAPNTSQAVKVPVACLPAQLTYAVEFIGPAPKAGAGLRIAVGAQQVLVGWSAVPRAETVQLATPPAGTLAVDLSSLTAVMQTNVQSAIRITRLSLTCG